MPLFFPAGCPGSAQRSPTAPERRPQRLDKAFTLQISGSKPQVQTDVTGGPADSRETFAGTAQSGGEGKLTCSSMTVLVQVVDDFCWDMFGMFGSSALLGIGFCGVLTCLAEEKQDI